MTRKSISKKLRFEVFKRDSFTCQYCGSKAPDVILHVDHINPVASGGDNDILNLITSCEDCNQGKGARELDDQTVLAKQREQIEELNRRREQLEMMVEWREAVQSIDAEACSAVEKQFCDQTELSFSDFGRRDIQKLIKKHGFAEVSEALYDSLATYFKPELDEDDRNNSAGKALNMLGRVIANKRRNAEKPWMKDLFYARAIIRNRMYCNERVAIDLLEAAFERGADIEELKDWAKQARNWTVWRNEMNAWIAELGDAE